MKYLFTLGILLSFHLHAACPRVKAFKDLRYDEINCKLFGVVELVEPKVLHQGDWLRLAIKTIDADATAINSACVKNPQCFVPYQNWKDKMDAFCRKLGFKRHSDTRTHVFHFGVEKVGIIGLKKDASSSLAIGKWDGYHSTLKKIYCQ